MFSSESFPNIHSFQEEPLCVIDWEVLQQHQQATSTTSQSVPTHHHTHTHTHTCSSFTQALKSLASSSSLTVLQYEQNLNKTDRHVAVLTSSWLWRSSRGRRSVCHQQTESPRSESPLETHHKNEGTLPPHK